MLWKSRSRSRSSAERALAWVVLAACLALPGAVARADRAHACVLVVSPDVEVENLTSEEVRQLFWFRRQFWAAGKPVNLILVESDLAEGSCLLDQVYRMDAKAFRTMVREKLYRAEIELAPKVVASAPEAVVYATHGEGVLTLVPADAIGDADVRVLTIDGKSPGAPGYPLTR